jgi:hypothetical protein
MPKEGRKDASLTRTLIDPAGPAGTGRGTRPSRNPVHDLAHTLETADHSETVTNTHRSAPRRPPAAGSHP